MCFFFSTTTTHQHLLFFQFVCICLFLSLMTLYCLTTRRKTNKTKTTSNPSYSLKFSVYLLPFLSDFLFHSPKSIDPYFVLMLTANFLWSKSHSTSWNGPLPYKHVFYEIKSFQGKGWVFFSIIFSLAILITVLCTLWVFSTFFLSLSLNRWKLVKCFILAMFSVFQFTIQIRQFYQLWTWFVTINNPKQRDVTPF